MTALLGSKLGRFANSERHIALHYRRKGHFRPGKDNFFQCWIDVKPSAFGFSHRTCRLEKMVSFKLHRA